MSSKLAELRARFRQLEAESSSSSDTEEDASSRKKERKLPERALTAQPPPKKDLLAPSRPVLSSIPASIHAMGSSGSILPSTTVVVNRDEPVVPSAGILQPHEFRNPPPPPLKKPHAVHTSPSMELAVEENHNQSFPLRPEPTQSLSFLDIQRRRRKKQPSIFDVAEHKKFPERQQTEETDSVAAVVQQQQQQNNSVSQSLPNTFPRMVNKSGATSTNSGVQNRTILEVRNMTPDSMNTGDENRSRGGGYSFPLVPQQPQHHMQNKCVESGYGSMKSLHQQTTSNSSWMGSSSSDVCAPNSGQTPLTLHDQLLAVQTSFGIPGMPQVRRIVCLKDHQYLVFNKLGSGGSSVVYTILDESCGKEYAMKLVDFRDADDSIKASYRREIEILEKLQQYSDCVVRMFDYEFVEGNPPYLMVVMEKGDTDLANFLKSHRQRGREWVMEENMIAYYWQEMLLAVKVIHEQNIIHSDLKPANFLLVAGALKLIDFGIANAVPSHKTSVTKDYQMGTPNYMSPEALKGIEDGDENEEVKFKVGPKSDVWSLGCILYNMVFGKTPYAHITNHFTKVNSICSSKPVTFPTELKNKQLMDVMKKCLEKDPKKRPSIAELLTHPYLLERSDMRVPATAEEHKKMQQTMLISHEHLQRLAESMSRNSPRTNARILTSYTKDVEVGKYKLAGK